MKKPIVVYSFIHYLTEVEHLPLSTEKEPKPLHPPERMAETAQIICDPNENPEAHAAALEQALRLHYQALPAGREDPNDQTSRIIYMDEKDPIRYEYNVGRGVWNALAAPIINAIEVDLIKHALPYIHGGRPLAPPEIRDVDFDRFFTASYEAQGLAFMRTANAWAAGAAERVMRQIESDRSHWCRPIWEQFCARHPQFCFLEAQAKKPRRTYSPYWEIMSNSLDANATAWSVLGPALAHIRGHEGASAEDTRRILLSRVEELSWAASMTSTAFGSLASRAGEPSGCPFRVASKTLWQVKSLAHGPWAIEKYCPANIEVVLYAEPHSQETTDALYAAVKRDSGETTRLNNRKPGGGKAAEMRLSFGSYLLSELAS